MRAMLHASGMLKAQPIVAALSLALGLLAIPAHSLAGSAQNQGFNIEVVSSAVDQVTGGDARLHVTVPSENQLDNVSILVNGVDQSSHFSPVEGTNTLSGVVDGLALGANEVTVMPGQGQGEAQGLTIILTNYPITGPVFSGPHQQPFICTVQRNELGQPIADSDSGFPAQGGGFSRNCSANTRVDYVYRAANGQYRPYTLGGPRPADMVQTTTMDGKTVDFIVRWERGTINRFIYSIAVLAPDDASPTDLSRSAWNGKAIFHFQGGVGIGHYQGDASRSAMLYDYGLSQGYAILYSTGTRTSTHYNLVLGGETALMVKERFVELYDVPVYTVGLGGSGGAIQQYVYAQNHPGLIDAAIPQYSYPDMVTQAVHVGDCELLEFYMDVLDAGNPRWAVWDNRTILEGMNASDTFFNPYTQSPGSTECINGWRGLSPLALNPHYGRATGMEQFVPIQEVLAIKWTHFDDLVNIFGLRDSGHARRYWDNVGVQYGLAAAASGQITPEEFLKLNALVGGWKEPEEMVQEGSPFFPPGSANPLNWDPWSARNQNYSMDPTAPAPRTQGDLEAMHAAYESGLVFMGDIVIPIIDWRHYLEERLDMHNSHQSFAARQRIRDARGNSDNQVIWFTDIGPNGPEFDQTPEALQVMDEWMMNILSNPGAGVAGNKPPRAADRCFERNGAEIAAGEDVWDGILDGDPAGACTQRFPVYSTPRMGAGNPIRGSYFKCALQPVSQAVASGLYGVWTPSPQQVAQLETIFPAGVCDYTQPDAGLPPGW